MEISNEQEFEYFLGNLWNAAKKMYNSPQGQAVKKDFVSGAKAFDKKMVPSLGRNLGGYFGGNTGAQVGGALGDVASNLLFNKVNEAELTDYVRVIRKAANYLNRALAQGSVPLNNPKRLVTSAINQAARPVYSRRQGMSQGSSYSYSQNQGRWIRQGNKLILQGIN